MSAVDETPFVEMNDDGDPIRVPDRRVGGQCYGSSEDGGECETMDLSFDSIEEWEEHRRAHHPVGCDRCGVLAAYKRDNSLSSYCYKHIPDEPDVVYKWRRTNTESVVEPPKAEGHIIEAVLPP